MPSDTAVGAIHDSLSKLKAKLLSLKEAELSSIQKLKERAIVLEKELVLDAPPSGELSIVAQVLIEKLMKKVDAQYKEIAVSHRAIHAPVNRVGKQLEKKFVKDLSGLLMNQKNLLAEPEDRHSLASLINEKIKKDAECDIVYKQALEHGFGPSKRDHSDTGDDSTEQNEAAKSSRDAPNSSLCYFDQVAPNENSLKFDIIAQKMFDLIQQGNVKDAIALSKKLSGLGRDKEIPFIMGAFLAKKDDPRYDLFRSPYAWPVLQMRMTESLYKEFNDIVGLVQVGATVVPTLLNLKVVMAGRQDFLFNGDELPIEFPVEAHHSTFTCPILRQQATDQNPPMRLRCGHVISRDALNKLATYDKVGMFRFREGMDLNDFARNFRFKCPYCSEQSSVCDALRVYF